MAAPPRLRPARVVKLPPRPGRARVVRVAPAAPPRTAPAARRARLPEGPRLQLLNLAVLAVVASLTTPYPNAWPLVLLGVGLAGALDALASRARYGGWRVPWPTLVGALGIALVLDLRGDPVAPALLAALMVGSKHLVRWRGGHLFNPNNFAATALLLAGLVRVGVDGWGGAPHVLALVLLFGTVATLRVRRFDLAVAYLALTLAAHLAMALAAGGGAAQAWAAAFTPLQVVIAFFAITDPATSPDAPREKALWAALLVAMAAPLAVAGVAEAPIYALFAGAPLRHAVRRAARARGGAVAGVGAHEKGVRPRGAGARSGLTP